jgi:hypothetical protein
MRDRTQRLTDWYRETAALALKLESESEASSASWLCEGCGSAIYRDSGRFCHECLLFVGDSLAETQSLQRRIEELEEGLTRIAGLEVVVESHADCANIAIHGINIARKSLSPKEQPEK